MRFFVIGDIHGCAAQLNFLLDNRSLYADRHVVFLGDYVDVGPDSAGVVELLLEFAGTHPEVTFLRGNHDVALLQYMKVGSFPEYAARGGLPTIRSYCGEVHGDVGAALRAALPPSHLKFINGLLPYLETPAYLFSHAGYDVRNPNDRSEATMCCISHQSLFEGVATLGKLAVCGHYFQATRKPFISTGVICLDSGCGILEGPLTAMTLPERSIVQVTPELELIS